MLQTLMATTDHALATPEECAESDRAARLSCLARRNQHGELRPMVGAGLPHHLSARATRESEQLAFMMAVRFDAVECAAVLLEAGCPLETVDDYGRTVLHLAGGAGHVRMLNFFLALPGSTALLEVRDTTWHGGATPLLRTAAEVAEAPHVVGADYARCECARMLVRRGASAYAEDMHGRTAAHLAALAGRHGLANWLDFTRDFKDLHWACEARDAGRILRILRGGGDDAEQVRHCRGLSTSGEVERHALFRAELSWPVEGGAAGVWHGEGGEQRRLYDHEPRHEDLTEFGSLGASMRQWLNRNGARPAAATPLQVALRQGPPPFGLLPPDGMTVALVRAATLPWAPNNHCVQTAAFRRSVFVLLCVANRRVPGLPFLTIDSWFAILARCGRGHWDDV